MLLLELLQERYPDSSKTTLRKMLQEGRVRVNGAIARDARTPLAAPDRVDVVSRAARQLVDPRVSILFQDEDIVVIHKASGLLTVANAEERHETAEALLDAYLGGRRGEPRVHVVHRLDRDSSGVLVFARNAFARSRLQERFATHDLERRYIAIVHGRPAPAQGTIRSHLAEDRALRVRSVANAADGKEAITHYVTVAAGPRYARVEVTLETGRRNQIRVHFAESGHPIVGDAMYAPGRPDPLGRLALHATTLAFLHPRTHVPLSFTVPMPDSFARLAL